MIVGGGPSGLFLSNLLSQYNVPNVLLERQTTESRFRHPQAHFLNTRTMELLKYNLPFSALERIQRAMPPVEQWRDFRFVHSMSDIESPLAHVRHPVDRPLSREKDANGVLLLEEGEQDQEASIQSDENHQELSPCSVGHLAQHTFCRILYDLAKQHESATIRYGTHVTSVTKDYDDDSEQCLTVHCEDGSLYKTPLVIAADGASSPLRTSRKIGWHGQHGMQHLMNIHVTLDLQIANELHAFGDNTAMLYSVFNEHVVAMVVCHSLGDYIIQIPFFPPYQTLQDDFSDERLETIVQAIFGKRVGGKQQYTIQSAKAWTMSSMIAERYYDDDDDDEQVVLVGDAAHVFPPAGGFGMNTGLQDVHNLAWKLAYFYHCSDDEKTSLQTILQSYENDRRPIAQENAALSVRNYQRLLQVTSSCYLNEKHPNLLVKILDQSPLPMAAKQTLFRSLFQAALRPLSWLGGSQSNSIYATHIRNNIRQVLRTGAGLPLLFPRFELGFQYGKAQSSQSEKKQKHHWRKDTLPVAPEIAIGKLLPHTSASVCSNVSCYPNLRFLAPNVISTSNLPAQVSRDKQAPSFVLLVNGHQVDSERVFELRDKLTGAGLLVEIVWMNPREEEKTDGYSRGLVLRQVETSVSAFSFETHAPMVVLIRPDSHVCCVLTGDDELPVDDAVVDALRSFRAVVDSNITHKQ